MAEILEITDKDFDNEVLKEGQLTLVDFWATWCGPCRKLSPILEELANDFAGKVKFVKIKADENTQTAQKYSISGVPSLLIFYGTEPVERMVNIVPKSVIANNLNKYIKE